MKSLAVHISQHHKIDSKKYYDEHIKTEKEGICKTCGNQTNFKNFSSGYYTYCSKSCINKDKQIRDKIKETNLSKYGVENPFQSEFIKDKIKATNLEKYGVTNPSLSDEIKLKKIQSCKSHFGVEYPFQSDIVKEKVVKTCIERYGVENVSQLETVKEKKSKTTLQNFGEVNPFKSDVVKDKIKQTNLKRYGVENPSSSEGIKQKRYSTTFSHYGVEIPYKSKEIRDKGFATLKENNNFNTSKFEETTYELLCEKFGENDIERQYNEYRYPFYCIFM